MKVSYLHEKLTILRSHTNTMNIYKDQVEQILRLNSKCTIVQGATGFFNKKEDSMIKTHH